VTTLDRELAGEEHLPDRQLDQVLGLWRDGAESEPAA
jgi:hypothetical protein